VSRDRAAMRRVARVVVRVAAGLALPTLLYYVLRAAGMPVYGSLLVSTLVSAAPGLVTLARERRVDGLSAYFTAMVLGALVISLIPGATRFLLAKEAVLTAVTGVWFLASVRAERPLVYLFTRPVLQGRLRWPRDWDAVWEQAPRLRRMWRVSSVIWGVGLLVDAAVRVLMAWTLPPDDVPGLATALYAVMVVLLNLITHTYYTVCGVHHPGSALYSGVAGGQRTAWSVAPGG
jgi:hypothetical protein